MAIPRFIIVSPIQFVERELTVNRHHARRFFLLGFYAAILTGNLIGYFIFLILSKLLRLCYDAWLRRRQARQPSVESQAEDRRRESAGIYELLVRVEQREAGRSREG